MTAKNIAHNIVNEIKAEGDARQAKIKQIAEKLAITFMKAESLVKQEEARKKAGEKYRQSEAYHKRLEQQKLVRQMMKA